jgi:hypothetical protein
MSRGQCFKCEFFHESPHSYSLLYEKYTQQIGMIQDKVCHTKWGKVNVADIIHGVEKSYQI